MPGKITASLTNKMLAFLARRRNLYIPMFIIKWYISYSQKKYDMKDIITTRQVIEKYAGTKKRAANTKKVKAGSVPALWIEGEAKQKNRHILYLHGGGYVLGSINTHQDLAHMINRAATAKTLIIDYRLAPEHPYPAAADDALSAYKWMLKEGVDPGRTALVGDSAGGGLALALLHMLKEKKYPLPSCAVCISPWTDLTCSGPSLTTKKKTDPMVHPEGLKYYASVYAGERDLKHPFISPLFGDFKNFPPLLLHASSAEVLLDDSLRLAECAKASGADVEIEIWPGMIHVWHSLARIHPAGRRAIKKIGEFIIKHIPG